ncbi:MAG: YebC/PmpR family DNA-binding transcriptional regulator [Brumimicrobium sp.]|nr:YebC/PmpR family DNA-binding transcriptional regulator [Brumimicrobium sp.]
MGRAFEYRRAAKEKRWDKMSRLFPRLGKAITLAAKEGGGDPETNARLRTAIQNAKAENMPKVNIENAIKRATEKDMANFVELTYEGKGPHGSLFFVECTTDNPTRTVANVKSYFNKAGGQIVPNGSTEFMFTRKAVFFIQDASALDLDELELDLIDAGLDSIEKGEENSITLLADYTNFGTMQDALEAKNIEVTKAELKRFPTSPLELSEEQMDEVEKLLDKLEEDDDVHAVFTNIE